MSRQAFFRVLLSLLLLVSQQMAMSHALSHFSAAAASLSASATQEDDERDLSSAVAQDKSCHQCLAFAHLTGPLGNTPRAFAAPDLLDIAPFTALAAPRCVGAVCPFQSRAPPQA
jgi:hypothetical protein